MFFVESLVQQCQTYIVMHLEEFSISHLSLLPLSTRKDLLYQLPIADICSRLENTDFTTGLDMAAFWNSAWEHGSVGITYSSHDSDDIKHYVQDKWDDTEYAREMVYGIVATCALGCLPDIEFRGIFLPIPECNCETESDKRFGWGMPLVSFLYAVRKICIHDRCCKAEFPPRYSRKSSKNEKDLTMYEVVNCFSHNRGEFPRFFPEFVTMSPINLDHVYFLRNATYLAISSSNFDEQLGEFLKAVLKEVTNLEVLVWDHWDDEWEMEFLDEFCTYLPSCQSLLSNFRLLKILSTMDSRGYVVSRKNFNQLITAYFAAPTDHMQKLQISCAKIKCSDISYECSPRIDQRYLAFKTLELDDCQFVSKYKATPQTISHWLGQGISELPQSDCRPNAPGSYFFKVGDKNTRKRKHSDMEENA